MNRAFRWAAHLCVLALVAMLVVAMPAVATSGSLPAGGAAPIGAPHATASKIVGIAPRPVASSGITPHARRDPRATLSLNLGLEVHNSRELDAVIRGASTPGSPTYGQYLSEAQYRERYAPTLAEVESVRGWATAHGMRVTGVTPDNLIVSVEAPTAAAELAFGVSIGEYRAGNRAFHANDVAPSVHAGSSVRWVTGLDNYTVARSFAVEPAFRTGGYFPSDFQSAYNTGGATTTQTIGITLWGAPLVQSDLNQFAADTGAPTLVINGSGANGIEFIACSATACGVGHSTDTRPWVETAMDVQHAHGVAPGSHLKYWLGRSDMDGNGEVTSVEVAVNAAANDTSVQVVSNSWGLAADISLPNLDASLQHAASVGKTFYFSSGDDAALNYPATSPYVVAVGGTSLNLSPSFEYVSESTWSGSGTGCSAHFPRPSWQIGVGAATCTGRAEPDVAADAAPSTGAYVFVDGQSEQVGGTSLAAPLWAGMTAVWNQANLTAGKPPVGFAAPLFYSLGNNPGVYNQVFHDITTGSAGGNPAGPGWDQVTGWGSPNLANLIAVSQGLTATSTTLATSKNPTTVGSTVVYTATVSPIPNGGTVTFRRNGKSIGGCIGKGLSSAGRAACSVAHGTAATLKVQAGYSGNADFSASASNIVSEKVNPAPGSAAGYWMVGRGGAVYGFGSSAWRGSANTQNVTHFEPTPSRKGYWIVNGAGRVFAFGDARALGSASGLAPGESVSSLSATASGNGYWLFTSKGRTLRFGDAKFYGDLRNLALNGPVIGSVATPTGRGYYMVASDGGIFSFGDAAFYGSTGHLRLNKPVNGLVPTPTNRGYWMVASDGGIFAFGDASFRGSMGGRRLNDPVVGMVRYGNGYLMVGADGGIFNFSNQPFLGSLAGTPLPQPIVAVAS